MPNSNHAPTAGRTVNNFSLTVGTANGSGSQTSNLTLVRSFFKMGIPVSGKNVFPSNIQGLPTWYTIRLSKDGYLARSETTDIVVAMNSASFTKDQEILAPGGAIFYDDSIKQDVTRDDIQAYGMPVKAMTKAVGVPANLRTYAANMVYVGVLAYMLEIDLDRIKQAIEFHFGGKEKPITLNLNVINESYSWAAENLDRDAFKYRVEVMDGTDGYIMTDGNTAAAFGSIFGGVQFIGWYPITPATSVVETINQYLPEYRNDPETGKATYASIQAEDELAAVGMAVGAGWAGLRSMTSTSGPGISLMSEYVSMAYYAETPLVIWNVQRMGPSTGLPTRTSQGDINTCYYLGHGDTKHVVLLPGDIAEIFEFGWKAFDYAEQLQTPIFVLTDLDFGMNQWMTRPFEYPDTPINRGKILWEEDLDKIENWGRYLDIDGDGIPYRTVPGNRHPRSAYFTRGTGHDEYAKYSEEPEMWAAGMERLLLKFETGRDMLPKPEIHTRKGAKIGLIAFGSTDPAVHEACDLLETEGVAVDYLRLRALPINDEVKKFIENYEHVYVVEMNRDGQLHGILSLEMPAQATSLIPLLRNDGMPLAATWIKDALLAEEQK
ncbi:MAG: 2-oxoacid:acceptor oxidoreductase subunit alpha [Chloroflexota bacterium]